MLPWMKQQQEASASTPAEPELSMLDAVAEDMMNAFKNDDLAALRAALAELCDHIATADAAQDKDMR